MSGPAIETDGYEYLLPDDAVREYPPRGGFVLDADRPVWFLVDQRHEVNRLIVRGSRYVVLAEADIPDGADLQVGDVLVLWAGAQEGDGTGLAFQLQHETLLADHGGRPLWRVYQISEPREARYPAGGEEDDGGD